MTQRIPAIKEGTPVNNHARPERGASTAGTVMFSVAVTLGIMLLGTLG